jgi:cell division protein FtsL
MRSVELKDDLRTASRFRRGIPEQREDIFIPATNREFNYVPRKFEGVNMSDDYLNEGATRARPYISREDTDLEREKRLAAHTALYEERYNQARRMEEEQESARERRRVTLRDLDDRPQRVSEEPEDSRTILKDDRDSQPLRSFRDIEIPKKDRDFYAPQYDFYREYESGPYTYNRNRIDNEAYQSTFVTQNAPIYRPSSDVSGYAASIAERYKKQFAERELDLQPSAKTMQYAEKKPDEKVKSFKINKKERTLTDQEASQKGLLTMYITIVVVIAVLIATTAMMISNLSQDISALEYEIAQRQNLIALSSAELSKYDDDNYIYAKAKEQGMQDNQDTYTVELIPLKYQSEPKGGNNWFDALCDFLSGVFGSSS